MCDTTADRNPFYGDTRKSHGCVVLRLHLGDDALISIINLSASISHRIPSSMHTVALFLSFLIPSHSLSIGLAEVARWLVPRKSASFFLKINR